MVTIHLQVLRQKFPGTQLHGDICSLDSLPEVYHNFSPRDLLQGEANEAQYTTVYALALWPLLACETGLQP